MLQSAPAALHQYTATYPRQSAEPGSSSDIAAPQIRGYFFLNESPYSTKKNNGLSFIFLERHNKTHQL